MADKEDDISLLEEMLLQAETEEDKKKPEEQQESVVKPKKSFFQDDSSDEEERSGLFTKYNDFGREINKKLKQDEQVKKYESIKVPSSYSEPAGSSQPCTSSSLQSKPPQNTSGSNSLISAAAILKETVFCDPVFGLRIVNPAISSASLKERMINKIPVGVGRVRFHTERGDKSQDWVIAGVLVGKSPVKQTQKGDQFSIWTISDLKGEIKTCTVFLFRSAHKELWKHNIGVAVAILNPNTLERKDDKVEAVLSVDNAQKVMILGQSKDYGTCKVKKNNGDPCGQIVNKTDCDVCIFHMKREYGKYKRSDLQTGGLGPGLQALKNKVLGKSEVFYAGQSFSATAAKAKKPLKQMAKDRERMMTLSEYYNVPYNGESSTVTTSRPLNRSEPTSSSPAPRLLGESSTSSQQQAPIKRAATFEHNTSQRKKDLERLKMLQGTDTPEIVLTPKFQAEQQRLRANESSAAMTLPKKDPNFVPKLSQENLTFSFSLTPKSNEVAKRRAAEILKKKPLEQTNPNLLKYRGTEAGKKRIAEEFNKSEEGETKKVKIDDKVDEAQKKKDFIKRMMNATSSHADLGESLEREKQQKCFDRLEKKEAMEERMANTTEMSCKAVICNKCKYIYFSASDLCRMQKHKLKIVDATKRFYQCGDCKARTITLFRIPKDPCRHCHSSNWKRTGMMADKIAYVGEKLSIRGDEEMFIGSATKANVNLLVPESN